MLARLLPRLAAAAASRVALPARTAATAVAAATPTRKLATDIPQDQHIRLNLGVEFPNFEVDTTHGKMKIHDYIGDNWTMLFSHPRDYTPVCTTELSEIAKLQPEFADRGVKLIALSCDSNEEHEGWKEDICAVKGSAVEYPIIADSDRSLSVALGFLDPSERDLDGLPVPVRAVVIIGPDKKVKLTITYPPSVGRNTVELLRVMDALQLGAQYGGGVATPVNWQQGDDVMITPGVSAEQAAAQFPQHRVLDVPSGKQYLRMTPLQKK